MIIRIKKSIVKLLLLGVLTFIVLIFGLNNTALGSLISSSELQNGNILAVFLTGLIVGGLTCLAVQGGLLAATIAQRSRFASGNALPILSFLLAKLVAYTVLGFLLGWIGSAFQLSLTAKTIMQFVVALFMIGTALSILEVHPIFRYFIIQSPKFLTRLVRKQSKRADLFAPVLLGAFTVFIPCGTTQAMMALSIASGSPLMGAAILFAFVLGTSPLFFILGYFATKLGDAMQQKFMKVAAYALILLAVFNLNGAIALTGSTLPFATIRSNDTQPRIALQNIKGPAVVIEADGYVTQPNNLTIKAGSQVTLNLVNNGGRGCTQAFTIPTLGIQKIVPVGTSDTITFTAPSSPGKLAFMCSMGMYRGMINVI